MGSPDFNIHPQLSTFTWFGNKTYLSSSTASSVNYALIQGATGESYLNGGNSLTLRVDTSTKLVLNSNNNHTLGGNLTITGGEISSTNTNMLLTSGTWQYIGFHNSLSTTANVFQLNHYTHIKHNGGVQ